MSKPKTTELEEGTMGFKDKQKALNTLKVLDGRDISYQYHVIMSFVSRTKRTQQITKDEEKLANLREAQKVFEDWLTDYKENNRGKDNLAYLPIETVKCYRPLAKKYGVLDDSFYEAYRKEKGDYKSLRGVTTDDGETTWDIKRNRKLKDIISTIKTQHIQWYETDVGDFRGFPTKEHIQCILLGYSPEPTKVKKIISQLVEKFGTVEETTFMDIEEQKDEEYRKRSHQDSSSSSNSSGNEEPKKKASKIKEKTAVNQEKEDSGLGFKDKQKALHSIESLEGRDISYQYHAISGLIKRAERVISCTKDEDKINNIKEAIRVFENWITDYNVNSRWKDNFGYLTLDIVRAYKPLADKYGIKDNGFLKIYEQEEGDYKKLRSIKVPKSNTTWDVQRNKKIRLIIQQIEEEHIQWFNTDDNDFRGLPSQKHTQCIMWGFSHDATKLKKLIPTIVETLQYS